MPWPGISLQFPLLLLAATIGPPGVRTEGNVGCLFSERLCLEDEWCYDDYAFGRCLRPISDVDEDDIFRYNLKREELHALKQELQRLFALGYRWSHGYTQCRLQAMLYANKHDLPSDADACSHLVDQDLEGALNAMEGQDPLDPNEMAIIKYMPSEEDPNAIYADEVYYPPIDEVGRVAALREKIYPSNAEDILDMEDPLAQYEIMKREWIPQMHRRSVPTAFLNAQESGLGGQEVEEPLEFLPGLSSYDATISDNDYAQNYDLKNDDNTYLTLQEMRDMYPLLKFLNKMQLTPADLRRVLSPENYQTLERMLEEYEDSAAKNEEKLQDLLNLQFNNDIPDERFTLTYNTPDSFRAGLETRDGIDNSEDYPESRVYFDENEDYAEERGSGQHQYPPVEIFRELKNSQLSDDYRLTGHGKADGYIRNVFRHGGPNFDHTAQGFEKFQGPGQKRLGENRHSNSDPGIYTEGGVVYGPDSRSTTGQSSQHVQHDDWNYNLDNLLEKYKLGFKRPERLDVKKPGPPFNTRTTEDAKKTSYVNEDNMILPSMMKKGPRGAPHPYPHKPDFYDMDDSDSDYVYVGFNKDFKTWGQGQDIIRNISSLLHLEPSNFENGHVIGNIVTFKVLPNSRGLNASEVAKRVYSIKDVLTADTGLRVIEAGIKDREKMQAVLSAPIMNNNEFYIVIFMVCGVLGAMIIAAALLILIRRHIRSREKLQNLGRPDTEASKDYQDLCRVRMASKGQPTSENAPGRITSLSKESEQSPSSRSSTSSWSEEPALHNMDISTGHMVLSYMEDHLKNKDRLEQEWVALCAYLAEPCETTIATKNENSEKNRYPEIIPYNHSRVVLNELSNAASWDYINASSITDHDPRNPAYIATQGPLPHTSADFWQLIWEQGAVVIVMLTRLTESGSAMCHRYWPEEGSELYHIYEVHLVSEHIWCDDYLVRSFYLKNARTGETRTVTQFHFLSWPETGVPASTKALLEFRRKVNKSYRGRSCPIVVHCSDGAGRTGTYCLIDMVLSRMAKGAKEIDIAATLEHLRDQRPKMVATKQQFEFVLTAVAEEVHAILKALPPQPANQAPEKEK